MIDRIMNKLLFIIINVISINTISASTIISGQPQSIITSVSNMNEKSDYTFIMSLENGLESGNKIQVIFPDSYIDELGISYLTNEACIPACTLSSRTVSFTIPNDINKYLPSFPTANQVSLRINGVLNPKRKGGSGNFIVRSLVGNMIYDENVAFGSIGIGDKVKVMPYAKVDIDNNKASIIATYYFQFKTSIYFPKTSFILITLDSASNFPYNPLVVDVACSAFKVNGFLVDATFVCKRNTSNQITITGFNTFVSANDEIGIQMNLQNPGFSQTTGDFTIGVYRDKTSYILCQRSDVNGVYIAPAAFATGSMSIVSNIPNVVISKQKRVDYIISFDPASTLQDKSIIIINIPSSFSILSNSNYDECYVIQGILNADGKIIKISYISDTQIQISDFKSDSANSLIKILVRLRNADQQGASGQFKVSIQLGNYLTYEGNIGEVSIQNISSADAQSIQLASFIADASLTDFTFTVIPSQALPNNAYIYILFPSGFTISALAASDCKIGGLNSNACQLIGTNTIKIKNNVNRLAGTSYTINIINKIKKPNSSYTALIDLTFKDIDDTTLIESHSDYIILQPKQITTGDTTKLLGSYSTFDVKTILNIRLILPSAINGLSDSTFILYKIESGQFDSNFGILNSYDYQIIPCALAQESQVLSDQLDCHLRINTQSNLPSIQINGLKAAIQGKLLSIFIPNLQLKANVNTFNYSIKIGNIQQNYNYYLYSTPVKTANLLVNSNSIIDQSNNYISPLNIQIGLGFNLIYPTSHSSNIGSLIYVILPTYSNGFIRSTSTSLCSPDTNLSSDCYYFPTIDQAIIQIPNDINIWQNGRFPTIVLKNLIYPEYQNPTMNNLRWYLFSFDDKEYGIYENSNFPVGQVRSFATTKLDVSELGANYVGVVYSFNFVPQDTIPLYALITITFPSIYNIEDSDPLPQVDSNTLQNISDQQQISVKFSQNVISITNFKPINALQPVDISISGIKNPTIEGQDSGYWLIETSTSGYYINRSSQFGSFTVTGSFTPTYVIFEGISCYPTNMNQVADYTFQIRFPNPIAKGSQIRIKFPSEQYIQLPQSPSCFVTNGLLGFESCTLDGTTFVIKTNTNYEMNQSITIIIEKILNPNDDKTKDFIITTIYDGQTLNLTDESTSTNRVISLSEQGNGLNIQSVVFNPRNEGELSVYTFTIIPTSSLNSNNIISILFPVVYDRNLGSSVYCSSQGLNSQINCNVSNRAVFISGIVSYTPSPTNPIILSIVNVINPNKKVNSNTGLFTVACFKQNENYYMDSNSTAIILEMLQSPGWTILHNVTSSSQFSRLKADYSMNIETFKEIPANTNLGSIIVQFPKQFNIPDSNTLICSATQIDYSSDGLTCSVATNQVSVVGNTSPYNGDIALTLKNIKNPTLEGGIDNLQVFVYDGFKKSILERTYNNLDPVQMSFSYSGPLINVNNGQPIVIDGGTVSDFIVIKLDYPSALDLTIKPISKGQLSLIPGNILLSRGDDSVTFRISVPQNLDIGTYYIQWEIVNDLSVPYYTPIQDTQVKVTANGGNVIKISELNSIPYMGNSLLTTVSIQNPPASDLTIYLAFSSYYEGVILSKSQLIFKQGDLSGQFYIQSQKIDNENYAERGTIILQLQGTNKDVYKLERNFLDFKVIERDYVLPVISSISIVSSSVSQTGIKINVVVSEISIVYYMVALAGTAQPSTSELLNKGPPPFLSSQSKYGSIMADIDTLTATISFNNLSAGNDYVIYALAQDRGNYSSNTKTLLFSTLPKYRTAQFVVRFLKASMNEVELQVARKTIAFILSVSEDQVLSKESSRRRILNENDNYNEQNDQDQQNQNIINQSMNYSQYNYNNNNSLDYQSTQIRQNRLLQSIDITMYLVSDFKRNNFKAPIDLIALLNNEKKAELKKRLMNYDPTSTITVIPYPITIPSLASAPTITSSNVANYISLSFVGNKPTYVYCVVIESKDIVIPEVIQVYRGLNSVNKEVPSNSTFVDLNKPSSFTIYNLSPSTSYSVFVVAGSDQPGFPDLQDKNSMYQLTYTTSTTPVVQEVVTSSRINKFNIIFYLSIIIIYYTFI